MTTWPDLTIAPLLTWPKELTREHRSAPFTADWSSTLDLLDREIYLIDGRNAVLQVAIEPTDFRKDGKPRANAKQKHPGVILSLDSMRGSLQLPCDTFMHWQDNLRAIALSMEALRKMERYGVAKRGEQYTGWKALNPGPSSVMSEHGAAEYIRSFAKGGTSLQECYRQARFKTHPDRATGSRKDWDRVERAAAVLGLR